MIDPEVARLRRLRAGALEARELGRRLALAHWGVSDVRFSQGAGIAWRLARVVSGKLNAHPYRSYQQGASLAQLLKNRLSAAIRAACSRDLESGLKVFSKLLHDLMRQLEDARSLTWSTEFSDTLGRSASELKALIPELRVAGSTLRVDSLERAQAGALDQDIGGDWPYLAF